MRIEHHVRLMNVARVRYQIDGVLHDLCPNCVDIVVDETLDIATVVMLRILGDFDATIDPIMLGRLSMPLGNGVGIVSADDGDGRSWHLTGRITMSVSPYKNEEIYLDHSFGRNLPKSLRRLYDVLNASRHCLVTYQRFLENTPPSLPDVRHAHMGAIVGTQSCIRRIETEIALKEALYDQQHNRADVRG